MYFYARVNMMSVTC